MGYPYKFHIIDSERVLTRQSRKEMQGQPELSNKLPSSFSKVSKDPKSSLQQHSEVSLLQPLESGPRVHTGPRENQGTERTGTLA